MCENASDLTIFAELHGVVEVLRRVMSGKWAQSAALFLLQSAAFSLQDAHTFNRRNGPHRLYPMRDDNFCINARRKFMCSSLDVPCLHIASRFVVLASVPRSSGHDFRLLIHN